MMKKKAIIAVVLLIFSCNKKETFARRALTKVDIETILQDSMLNVRALEINDRGIIVATSSGKIYRSLNPQWNALKEANYFEFLEDSLSNNNFRACAFQAEKIVTLSISTPAKLFLNGNLVYYENHPTAFYDSVDFWNDKEGIAIGDPTHACMSIVITRDGGNTWHKLSCNNLPGAKEGEAAFAASDTNIAIIGNHTWIATGGKASRILYSPDKGYTWTVFETPIIQGLETTGIYSIDFYDKLNGFAIGGDYTKPEDKKANKIRTIDGGKTWNLVAQNQNPGYRSCVQYMPDRGGKELVSLGFRGIDFSNDSGETWKHISDEGFYTIRFLNDSVAFAGGKGRISKLTFKE